MKFPDRYSFSTIIIYCMRFGLDTSNFFFFFSYDYRVNDFWADAARDAVESARRVKYSHVPVTEVTIYVYENSRLHRNDRL